MDYQKSQIYTIRSHKTNEIYVGSTCSPLEKRLYEHRKKYRHLMEGRTDKYTSSFEIIKHADHYIELLENFPCNSKNELRKKEGECIRQTENCVNIKIAGRSGKQWVEDNRNHVKEYQKQYDTEHKEEKKEYDTEYRKQNSEKIKAYKAKWYQDNKKKTL
jgi:hypothetical protein